MNLIGRLLRLFSQLLPLLLPSLKKHLVEMKNSFTRLVSSDRQHVTCTLEHRVSETKCVVFANMSFDRITGDLSINWTVDCPFSLAQKISEMFHFLKLVRNVG